MITEDVGVMRQRPVNVPLMRLIEVRLSLSSQVQAGLPTFVPGTTRLYPF